MPWSHKELLTHYYVSRQKAREIPQYDISRIGYCALTGQTNERTVLAGLVPGGCVAGNKIPTLRIYGNAPEPLKYLCYGWQLPTPLL